MNLYLYIQTKNLLSINDLFERFLKLKCSTIICNNTWMIYLNKGNLRQKYTYI